MWGWPTGIAATLLLIAVSGYLVVSLLKDQTGRQHAMKKEAAPAHDSTGTADSLAVGSGPLAQKDEPKEQKSIEKITPPSRARRSQTLREKDKVAAEEKPVDDEVARQKELLAAQKAEAEQAEAKQAEELDAAREALAVADTPPSEKKQEQNPVTESKRKSNDAEIAGATRSESASEVPARSPSLSPADSSPEFVRIKGKVRSATDGEGLPGVNVVLKGTPTGTVTDAFGNFELSVPQNTNLVVSFIGFETRELTVAGQQDINIELTEDTASLSEVVVTGYGKGNEAAADNTYYAAEPQMGRTNFKDYLEKSVKYPEEAIRNKAEGRVTVRFTVEPSGQLTGFEILKGIGSGCDEELIRVIKEGPPWKPAKQGTRAVSDKVKVRYRFELPK
jgi:TonB family protein